MHAPSRAEEGVELRSHSPSSVPWPPLPGRGRGPIPAFSISPSRRASLPGETTPERHRADRQELDDAELARRLQVGVAGVGGARWVRFNVESTRCIRTAPTGVREMVVAKTAFDSRLTVEF